MLYFVHLLSAGSLLFLTFMVFSQATRANQTANILLSIALFSILLEFLGDGMIILGLNKEYPVLFGFCDAMLFAIGPSIYLGSKYFTKIDSRFLKPDLIHFIPSVLFSSYLILLFSGDSPWLAQLARKEDLSTSWRVFSSLFGVQVAIYLVFSIGTIQKHQKDILLYTANANRRDLNWLLNVLYGMLFMLLISILERFFVERAIYKTPFYFVGIYYLGYYALQQKEIYALKAEGKKELSQVMEEKRSKNILEKPYPDSELALWKEKLIALMEKEKPYLDPEINLPALAHLIDISVHKLSFVLNEELHENFSQFVNRYRIEESKKLLKSSKHQHLNLLGIAYESGFNSKTAFNHYFKKITGLTPSIYKKSA